MSELQNGASMGAYGRRPWEDLKKMDEFMSTEKPCCLIFNKLVQDEHTGQWICKDENYVRERVRKRMDYLAACHKPFPAPSRYYHVPAEYLSEEFLRDCCRDVTFYDEDTVICFSTFDIDEWAALVLRKNHETGQYEVAAPLDVYYLSGVKKIMEMSPKYRDALYGHMMYIFRHCCVAWDPATKKGTYAISDDVIGYIGRACTYYGEHAECVRKLMLHLYYGMIAEEQKENSVLGRTIKMIAIHRIFKAVRDGVPVDVMKICNCDKRENGAPNAAGLAGIYAVEGIVSERALMWGVEVWARVSGGPAEQEDVRKKAVSYADALANAIMSGWRDEVE